MQNFSFQTLALTAAFLVSASISFVVNGYEQGPLPGERMAVASKNVVMASHRAN